MYPTAKIEGSNAFLTHSCFQRYCSFGTSLESPARVKARETLTRKLNRFIPSEVLNLNHDMGSSSIYGALQHTRNWKSAEKTHIRLVLHYLYKHYLQPILDTNILDPIKQKEQISEYCYAMTFLHMFRDYNGRTYMILILQRLFTLFELELDIHFDHGALAAMSYEEALECEIIVPVQKLTPLSLAQVNIAAHNSQKKALHLISSKIYPFLSNRESTAINISHSLKNIEVFELYKKYGQSLNNALNYDIYGNIVKAFIDEKLGLSTGMHHISQPMPQSELHSLVDFLLTKLESNHIIDSHKVLIIDYLFNITTNDTQSKRTSIIKYRFPTLSNYNRVIRKLLTLYANKQISAKALIPMFDNKNIYQSVDCNILLHTIYIEIQNGSTQLCNTALCSNHCTFSENMIRSLLQKINGCAPNDYQEILDICFMRGLIKTDIYQAQYMDELKMIRMKDKVNFLNRIINASKNKVSFFGGSSIQPSSYLYTYGIIQGNQQVKLPRHIYNMLHDSDSEESFKNERLDLNNFSESLITSFYQTLKNDPISANHWRDKKVQALYSELIRSFEEHGDLMGIYSDISLIRELALLEN